MLAVIDTRRLGAETVGSAETRRGLRTTLAVSDVRRPPEIVGSAETRRGFRCATGDPELELLESNDHAASPGPLRPRAPVHDRSLSAPRPPSHPHTQSRSLLRPAHQPLQAPLKVCRQRSLSSTARPLVVVATPTPATEGCSLSARKRCRWACRLPDWPQASASHPLAETPRPFWRWRAPRSRATPSLCCPPSRAPCGSQGELPGGAQPMAASLNKSRNASFSRS
eukprot:2049833-Prymnesium_polylepis.2